MSKLGDFVKGIGNSITGSDLLSFGGSLASLIGGNGNINKQLKAQKEENHKNREYNLMLAKMQNQWNQEQWERENEYNSPINQMKRFSDAGLNPDLIYGQSNTSGQISGGLTSGAPSTPQDFSALGQKMTIGEALKQSLETDLMRAQIDNIKADSESKRIGNESNKIDLETKQALQNMTGNTAEALIDKYVNSNYYVRKAIHELAILEKDYGIKGNELSSTSYDAEMKRIDSMFHETKVQRLLDKLKNELDLSSAQLDEFVKGMVYRLRGLEASTKNAEAQALWNDTSFLDKLPAGIPALVRLIKMFIPK